MQRATPAPPRARPTNAAPRGVGRGRGAAQRGRTGVAAAATNVVIRMDLQARQLLTRPPPGTLSARSRMRALRREAALSGPSGAPAASSARPRRARRARCAAGAGGGEVSEERARACVRACEAPAPLSARAAAPRTSTRGREATVTYLSTPARPAGVSLACRPQRRGACCAQATQSKQDRLGCPWQSSLARVQGFCSRDCCIAVRLRCQISIKGTEKKNQNRSHARSSQAHKATSRRVTSRTTLRALLPVPLTRPDRSQNDRRWR